MRLVEEHIETGAACASEHRFERQVVELVREKLRRIELPATLFVRASSARLASEESQSS